MNLYHVGKSIIVFLGFSFITSMGCAQAWGVAAPTQDETLIYVLREGRFTGGGAKMWIAVNDQTVARVKNRQYAVIRAKSGAITLNLASIGVVAAAIALDDRPGQTIYLRWRVGDTNLTEVSEVEGKKFIKKAKKTPSIDAPRANNEQVAALINLSQLGFDLMVPARERPLPDNEHAVITVFRRHGNKTLDFGIWSEHRYLGTLSASQGLDVVVPAGEYYFFSGHVGTTLLKAEVEAGRHYYVRLDVGKMILRVRLTPIEHKQSSKLKKWLAGTSWVTVNPAAITPRVREREKIVSQFVRSAGKRASVGKADFHLLGRAHAIQSEAKP